MPDNTKINTLRLRACDGEDIWRTINGAKVLIDEGTGEIKGGAGGKLNGKKFKPSFGKSLKSGKKVLLPSIHTKMKHFKGSKAQLLQNLKKAVEPPKKKTMAEVHKAYKQIEYGGLYGSKSLEDLEAKKKEIDEKLAAFPEIYAQLDKATVVKDPNKSFDIAYFDLSKPDPVKDLQEKVASDYKTAKNYLLNKQATAKAKEAWKKVVKYKTAIGAVKTQPAKVDNQEKLKKAYEEYKAAVAESPYGKVDFKPKTSSVEELLAKSAVELMQSAPGKAPKSSPHDPFITPMTDPGFTDRETNIQNTIQTLKNLSAAVKGNSSKYEFKTFDHQGAEGFKKTPLPTDDMAIHKKIVDKCSEAWKAATPAQKKAIFDYTGSFSKFNEPLRGIEYGTSAFKGVGKIDMDNIGVNSYGHFKKGEVKKLINDMTDIIDKSSYDHDVHVRRGVSTSGAAKLLGIDPQYLKPSMVNDLKDAVEGKLVTEFGFCSTAVCDKKGFTDEVELRILCPAGTKMMYAEPFSKYGHGAQSASWNGKDNQTSTGHEQEMILQRNTRFQIQRVSVKNGKVQIEMQVVAQDPVQFN